MSDLGRSVEGLGFRGDALNGIDRMASWDDVNRMASWYN